MSAAVTLPLRDDGALARALGAAAAGRLRRVPAVVVALAGVLPVAVIAAAGGGAASRWLAAAVLAWMVLVAGASRGAGGNPRLAWAAAPAVRAGEWVALAWIAALHGASAMPAAFALLCALAFRAYDLAYRARRPRTAATRWADAVALGWEGRVALAFLLLVLGALPAAFFAWAALLAVTGAGAAAAGWIGSHDMEVDPT